jgi:ribonuclease HI
MPTLYFDGLRNKQKAAYAYILEDEGKVYQGRGILPEPCTNNQAEYQALIKGLEKYHELGLNYCHLTIKGDSELVLFQLCGRYQVKHPNMIPLYQRVKVLLPASYELVWIPREQNKEADSLANLA